MRGRGIGALAPRLAPGLESASLPVRHGPALELTARVLAACIRVSHCWNSTSSLSS